MAVLLYLLGLFCALGCFWAGYSAYDSAVIAYSAAEMVNFQLAHAMKLALAVGLGIGSALFVCTGVILQSVQRPSDGEG